MSTVLRHNRKASDRDIKRLVSLGLSLTRVAAELGCHPTSITLRLHSLKIPCVDTRHSFMEQVLTQVNPGEPEQLADLFENNPDMNILSYVRELIQDDLAARRLANPAPARPVGDDVNQPDVIIQSPVVMVTETIPEPIPEPVAEPVPVTSALNPTDEPHPNLEGNT